MIFVWIWEYNIKFQVFTCLQYILFEREKTGHVIDFNFLNSHNETLQLKALCLWSNLEKRKAYHQIETYTPPPQKKIQNKISEYHF